MKVTLQFLKKHNACDGIEKFKEVFGKSADLKNVINYGIRSKSQKLLRYCNWIIVRKMTYKQRIRYAIYAAEQVIKIYEEKYPDDNRPRKAIQAAKKVLKENSMENRFAANAAAYDAYDAATHVDDNAAAHVAIVAANAAHAAYDAHDGTYAAYDAATHVAANADDAARINLRIKILRYGLKILTGDKPNDTP